MLAKKPQSAVCVSLLSTCDFDLERVARDWQLGFDREKRATATFRGLLQLAKSGHLVVAVPAAVVRGLYDSLDAPGLSLPKNDDGSVRSTVVVMTPEEVQLLGGPDKITERGRSFTYSFGDFFIAPAKNWTGAAKCWLWHVRSPELAQLRRTYGLPSKIDGVSDFSLMIAYQKSSVLRANGVTKAAQYLTLGEYETYRCSQFEQLAKRASKLAPKWYLGASEIEGTGVFAAEDLSKGDNLGLAILPEEQDAYGLRFRNLTTLSRYCNHSPAEEANVEIVASGDSFDLHAKRDIEADEELVADYGDVSNKVGLAGELVYNGEMMPRVAPEELTGRVLKVEQVVCG
jgi:hypothetical protein